MKIRIAFVAALTFASFIARADITIALDAPNQAGIAGETLVFSGTLFNSSPDTIFLNGVDFNLAGSSFTPDYLDPFLANVPLSLDPGQSTPDIELFEVLLNNPFTDPFATYGGNYALSGGSESSAQDLLASVDFTITAQGDGSAVPEPSSLVLLAISLAVFVAKPFMMRAHCRRRRFASSSDR
jgi:hypothetical protein